MCKDKLGTLVLYDSENMKVSRLVKNKYVVPYYSMDVFTERIKRFFNDADYDFVSFGKRNVEYGKTKIQKLDKHNENLIRLGYEVIEKSIIKKESTINIDGKNVLYTYHDGDMDSAIIHYLLTKGKNYNRIVLVSGDADMKNSLDFLSDEYNIEIWIVSHRERISKKYSSEYNILTIDELINEERK